MQKKITVEKVVDMLLEDGEASAVSAIKGAINMLKNRDAPERTVDAYLNLLGKSQTRFSSPIYLRNKSYEGERILCKNKVVQLIRSLQIPVELLLSVDHVPPPWNSLVLGTNVAFVFGSHRVESERWDQTLAIHAEDSLAGSWLSEYFGKLRLQLNINAEYLESADINNDFYKTKKVQDHAKNRLRSLLKDPSVGAVFVFGSPVTNPMAEPYLEMAYPHQHHKLGVKLKTPISNPDYKSLLLEHSENDFPTVQIGQTEIKCSTGKTRAPNFKRSDGGVLIMSTCSLDDLPAKPVALFAGAGSLGTVAAALAVTDDQAIKSRLSNNNPFFAVVSAKCKGKYSSDDFTKTPLPVREDVSYEFLEG